MEKAFFLVFAVAAVGSALAVVLARNPVHSALSLMTCFVQVAAIFVLLSAPFLAVIQIFVYVGAIMVLFLFVIMMLDIRSAALDRFLPRHNLPVLALLVVLGGQMLSLVFASDKLSVLPPAGEPAAIKDLSTALFTDYLFPFEVASVILLVALIGAIVLARKEAD